MLTRFQGLIFVFTLSPCLIFIGFGLPKLNPEAFTQTDNAPVNYALMLSWVIWLYSGFSSLGTIAGECDQPHVTYTRTIAILFPLVIMLNSLPFMVALSIDDDISHYQAGYFAQLAKENVGDWLRLGFVVASNVALVGLFNSQAITAQCTAFFFVESRAEYKQLRLDWLAQATRVEGTFASKVVPWLLDVPLAGVPRVYVIITAFASCCLCWLPYGVLVEFEVLLYCISQLLFFYSFVYLRAAYPDIATKFKLGTGVRSALAVVTVPVIICVANLYIGLYVSCEDDAFSELRRQLGDKGASSGTAGGSGGSSDTEPPAANASFDPGPNFKQQAFFSVVIIGGLIHGMSAMWVAPEVEVVPPEMPLEAPLTPSRRTSELQQVLSGAPGEEAASAVTHQRRHARRASGDLRAGDDRSISREGSVLYDAEQILDALLPQLAFSTSTAMRVDEVDGTVLNREEILVAYQETIEMQESNSATAGIVL
jgi:amino acid transporter